MDNYCLNLTLQGLFSGESVRYLLIFCQKNLFEAGSTNVCKILLNELFSAITSLSFKLNVHVQLLIMKNVYKLGARYLPGTGIAMILMSKLLSNSPLTRRNDTR